MRRWSVVIAMTSFAACSVMVNGKPHRIGGSDPSEAATPATGPSEAASTETSQAEPATSKVDTSVSDPAPDSHRTPPSGKPGPWDAAYDFDFGHGDEIDNERGACDRNRDSPVAPACQKIFDTADARKVSVVAPKECMHFIDRRSALLCPTACGNTARVTIDHDVMKLDLQYVPEGKEFDADRHREIRHLRIPLHSLHQNKLMLETDVDVVPPIKYVSSDAKVALDKAHVSIALELDNGDCLNRTGFQPNGRNGSVRVSLKPSAPSADPTTYAACDENIGGPGFAYTYCGEAQDKGPTCKAALYSCDSSSDCCSGICKFESGHKHGSCRAF
jgi:hypothetical protein